MRSNLAVVARRSEPPDSLDYFPTPPWATRALINCVLTQRFHNDPSLVIHEPACGEGHMAAVLREYYACVHASDIFPYGYGDVADYLDDGETPFAHWVITNPPFNKASEFLRRALSHPVSKAGIGVAFLVRTSWLEGGTRFREIFEPYPPTLIAQFAERVPMHQGRWEPKGKSATSYCWVIWITDRRGDPTFMWIPPGQRKRLTRADDALRFGAATEAPLLRTVADLYEAAPVEA